MAYLGENKPQRTLNKHKGRDINHKDETTNGKHIMQKTLVEDLKRCQQGLVGNMCVSSGEKYAGYR